MHQADKAELAWIRELSSPTIGEVTHPGFPAYLRVPHPAQDSDYQPVTWAHIAAGNGRELQALDTYADVAPEESSAWLDLAAPMQGELEENLLARLTALLSAHTSTPGRCTFLFHGSWFNEPLPPRRSGDHLPERVLHRGRRRPRRAALVPGQRRTVVACRPLLGGRHSPG
jgi:hypothetical protein